MSYHDDLPGLSEACLDALKALLVAGLPNMNAQLARRSTPFSDITAVAGQIYIGDADTVPDADTNPFWITVVGGGKDDGTDMHSEVNNKSSGGQYSYWAKYFHNVNIYLHPQWAPGDSAAVQAEARERLRSILQDWAVNDVFNNGTNRTVTLGSRQFSTAPAYDTLDECAITDVRKGYVFKSFGGTVGVFSVLLKHYGRVYGGL